MEQPLAFGKNFWRWVAVLAVVAAFLLWVFVSYVNRRAPQLASTDTATSSMILFYGNSCPHCQKVEAYLDQTPGASALPLSRLEVYSDKNNAEIMVEKARICGLDLNNLGVPLLWTGERCLEGDQPIEDFFNERLK